jgi:hypothetical protein
LPPFRSSFVAFKQDYVFTRGGDQRYFDMRLPAAATLGSARFWVWGRGQRAGVREGRVGEPAGWAGNMARAIQCDLVYGIVPWHRLIEDRAMELVERELWRKRYGP